MREIKFRAWDNEAELWRYFDIDHAIVGRMKPFEGVVCHICQFTGLKDTNGKEIFEGDIVRAENHLPHNYKIEFIEGGFCATNEKCWPIDMPHFYPSTGCEIEVIGNIYENPELLK